MAAMHAVKTGQHRPVFLLCFPLTGGDIIMSTVCIKKAAAPYTSALERLA